MVTIRTANGTALDAQVDFEGNAIVLHSRSGGGATTRNRDYRPALETILERLATVGVKPDIYLDSNRVDHLPLSQRQIVRGTQLTGSIPDQFNQIVRAMNAGRASNGAWSKIRLVVTPASGIDIAETVRLATTAPSPVLQRAHRTSAERLSTDQQRRVTSANIDTAVADLLDGNDAPAFAASRDYDLVTQAGDLLAPKKVFGRALELAGVVQEANPYHFSAGWSQPSFELLQAAGYAIVPKDEAASVAARNRRRSETTAREIDKTAATVPVDPEERAWIEGDKRMATHLRVERKRSAKAAAAKRAAVRAANDGRLACDHCETDWYAKYGNAIAEAIFDIHHTLPLMDMDEGHETTVDDLLCLCANCHRAEHRRMAFARV